MTFHDHVCLSGVFERPYLNGEICPVFFGSAVNNFWC